MVKCSKSIRSSIVTKNVIHRLRLSTMSIMFCGRDFKIMHKYDIIKAGLLKVAVIFTGLSFYSIAKMQWYLLSVIDWIVIKCTYLCHYVRWSQLYIL